MFIQIFMGSTELDNQQTVSDFKAQHLFFNFKDKYLGYTKTPYEENHIL